MPPVGAEDDGSRRAWVNSLYDPLGNVTSITRLAGTPDATATTMTYEAAHSRLASVTDPLDHTATFTYDASGNLKTATDARDKTTTFTHDSQGNLLTATDATSKNTMFGYFLGDLASVTDPGGNVFRQLVDGAGRVIATVDPTGGITSTIYDALNRPTSTVDAIGGSTSFTYDANGNVLTVTDPRGGLTTYTYDLMDRMATREDALTHGETYAYDLAGNLVEHTDRAGQQTAWEYDAIGRPSFVGDGKVGSGGSATYQSTTSFTYDAANRLLTAVDSAAGTMSFAYDDLDRLTSETSPQGMMSYTYDAADRRTLATLTGQPALAYAYDAADRLTSITQAGATVGYSYDDAGRPISMTYPDGMVATYAYDSAARLSGIEYQQDSTVVGDLTYVFDRAGRRTSVGGSLARIGLPAAVPTASYDAANRLTSWNGTSLSYDLNGNLTADGASTYTWNARGELTGIAGATSAAFAYDTFGRRISRSASGTTTDFTIDGANVVQERSGGGPSANLLTGAVDQIVRRTDPAGDNYFLTDALGSTLELVDNSGTIQTSYTYEPYGATTVTGTASTNPSQFTGRENDGTGLYFYRARYYQPTYGRFISEDPAGLAAGDPNLYRYVGNDPINATDPTGMFAPLVGACLGGAAFSVAFDLIAGALGQRKTTPGEILGSAASGCLAGLAGLGLGKLLGAIASKAAGAFQRTGINLVYEGFNAAGQRYIGITLNYAARAGAQLRNGIAILPLNGLNGLTRFQARAVEQALIQYYSLPALLNKINSIAPSNPLSQAARQEAIRVLDAVGGYDAIVKWLMR